MNAQVSQQVMLECETLFALAALVRALGGVQQQMGV
jgi:hypothetical protein